MKKSSKKIREEIEREIEEQRSCPRIRTSVNPRRQYAG
jgi:hypothetical protein